MSDPTEALRRLIDANGHAVAKALAVVLNNANDMGVAVYADPDDDSDNHIHIVGWFNANNWHQLSVEYDASGKQWVIVEPKDERQT